MNRQVTYSLRRHFAGNVKLAWEYQNRAQDTLSSQRVEERHFDSTVYRYSTPI